MQNTITQNEQDVLAALSAEELQELLEGKKENDELARIHPDALGRAMHRHQECECF